MWSVWILSDPSSFYDLGHNLQPLQSTEGFFLLRVFGLIHIARYSSSGTYPAACGKLKRPGNVLGGVM